MTETINKEEQTQNINWLKNPVFWAILSTLLAAIAILAAYNIFFLQTAQPALKAVILSNTSLVDIAENFEEDIEIRYQGKPISESLSFLQIKFENSGNTDISPEDYAQPLRIVFPAGADVISATVTEASPRNINPVLGISQNIVAIEPVLLNEGNRFITQFLIANIPADSIQPFEIDSRFRGIDEIPIAFAIDESRTGSIFLTVVSSIGAGVSVIAAIISLLWSVNWASPEQDKAIRKNLQHLKETARKASQSSRRNDDVKSND